MYSVEEGTRRRGGRLPYRKTDGNVSAVAVVMLSQQSAVISHQISRLPPRGPHHNPNSRQCISRKPEGGGQGNKTTGGRQDNNRKHGGGECVIDSQYGIRGKGTRGLAADIFRGRNNNEANGRTGERRLMEPPTIS